MGVVYSLYCREKMTYLDLGKLSRGWDGFAIGYSMAPGTVEEFLATCGTGTYELMSDCGDIPHIDEKGWTEFKGRPDSGPLPDPLPPHSESGS